MDVGCVFVLFVVAVVVVLGFVLVGGIIVMLVVEITTGGECAAIYKYTTCHVIFIEAGGKGTDKEWEEWGG